ncbi:MAG: MATE family efflux transporter, partial [bacterium]|nr:MATE family efflux transporter [Candidatus Kapabacteria bacterium]
WRLAVPLMFGFVINAVQTWINMFFVSRLGSDVIAALGVADQVNFVIFTLGSGFCIGTGIVVARRVGQDRLTQASVVATQAFSFMAVYSSILAVVLWFVLPYVLRSMQITGPVLVHAESYLLTLMFGFPASLLIFQANASVRSTGNTVFPMIVLIAVAVTNIILDPILIYGMFGIPAMGIRGAAIATVIAEWIGIAISATSLFRGSQNLKLYGLTLRFDWSLIASIYKLGVPASMQGFSVSLGRVLLIALANQFGTAAVAAYTIGARIDVLIFMPIWAAGIAIETMVSQNIGAGRTDRVKAFRMTVIRQLGGVILALAITVFFAAPVLASFFSDDPAVAPIAVTYLRIASFGYLFFVVGQTATRSLSGAGHSMRSMMIISGVLFGVQLPLAYLLALGTSLQVTGIFVAVTSSYLILAAVGTMAMRGDSWMMKRV